MTPSLKLDKILLKTSMCSTQYANAQVLKNEVLRKVRKFDVKKRL